MMVPKSMRSGSSINGLSNIFWILEVAVTDSHRDFLGPGILPLGLLSSTFIPHSYDCQVLQSRAKLLQTERWGVSKMWPGVLVICSSRGCHAW